MKIHPIGSEQFIEDDRPALIATPVGGRTDRIWLDYADPSTEVDVALGWFSVADLQKIIDAARGVKV